MSKARSEYKIVAIGHEGEVFIPHQFQSDVSKAVEHYKNVRDSIDTKARGLTISIEKHIVTRKVMDFTDEAEAMLKNGKV